MRELDVRQKVSVNVPYNTRCQSSGAVREKEKGPRRAVSIETQDRYGVEASEGDTKVCVEDPLTIKRYCRHGWVVRGIWSRVRQGCLRGLDEGLWMQYAAL